MAGCWCEFSETENSTLDSVWRTTRPLATGPGETPIRAAIRAIVHKQIGHAGLAALRQQRDKSFARRWDALVKSLYAVPAQAVEINAIAQEPAYAHLAGDRSALVEEWFARRVENMTEAQLSALPPSSALGKLWQWLKDALEGLTAKLSRRAWNNKELREIMALSKQALRDGGPVAEAGRVKQASVGQTLRQADNTMIEEALEGRLLDIAGLTTAQIAQSAAPIVQAWPDTIQAADGSGIDLFVADGGSLGQRVWHLIRNDQSQAIDPAKAKWLTQVPGTLKNAQVRLVDPQTGNRIYVRKYTGGQHHVVVVKPDGRVESQKAFTGSLATQFPLNPRNRQFDMKVEWVRPDLDNGQGLRQNAPQPALGSSTVSGPRSQVFRSNPPPSSSGGQPPGRISKSTPRPAQPGPDQDTRTFGGRVREDGRLSPETQATMGPEAIYDIAHNADTFASANALIDQHGLDGAQQILFDESNGLSGHVRVTLGQQLILRLDKAARAVPVDQRQPYRDAAAKVLDYTDRKGTEAGQTVQAFAMWALSP